MPTPLEVPGLSRRESPRLEVEALIEGHLVRGHAPLVLVDLGFGGFSVQSPFYFQTHGRHAFRFSTVDGIAVLINADVVYCRESTTEDGRPVYVTGFSFAVQSPKDQHAVNILIDAANSPLTFPA